MSADHPHIQYLVNEALQKVLANKFNPNFMLHVNHLPGPLGFTQILVPNSPQIELSADLKHEFDQESSFATGSGPTLANPSELSTRTFATYSYMSHEEESLDNREDWSFSYDLHSLPSQSQKRLKTCQKPERSVVMTSELAAQVEVIHTT